MVARHLIHPRPQGLIGTLPVRPLQAGTGHVAPTDFHAAIATLGVVLLGNELRYVMQHVVHVHEPSGELLYEDFADTLGRQH